MLKLWASCRISVEPVTSARCDRSPRPSRRAVRAQDIRDPDGQLVRLPDSVDVVVDDALGRRVRVPYDHLFRRLLFPKLARPRGPVVALNLPANL